MSLLVRDGVSTEQLSSRDGRRQRARSKIEERSSMLAATWELAVLCTAQQPPVALAHAFASSRVAKTPGGATAPDAKEANEPLRWPSVGRAGLLSYTAHRRSGSLDGAGRKMKGWSSASSSINLSLRLDGE